MEIGSEAISVMGNEHFSQIQSMMVKKSNGHWSCAVCRYTFKKEINVTVHVYMEKYFTETVF